jgi:hypothetical protein
MPKKLETLCANVIFILFFAHGLSVAQTQTVGGTLVVAVPVTEGLVACSDKRLFNDQTGTFDDSFVKIRKVNDNTFFVATHTVGFLNKTTGKLEFDVFDITTKYVSQHNFVAGQPYWDGLKKEIKTQLLAYLAKRNFKDWPETDLVNNRLLFNLVFFTNTGNTIRSYTLRVFYEKQATPIIDIPNVVSEVVRTPKLIGKGKDVIDYLSRNPSVALDPSILRFDQGHFDVKKTTIPDAVGFAKKLFLIANTSVPQSTVSMTYDCALLGYQNGFQFIDDSGSQKPAR